MAVFKISFLGEFVDPSEYFKISDYPSFLSSSNCSVAVATQPLLPSQRAPLPVDVPPSQPLDAQSGDAEVDLVCTEPSDMETGSYSRPVIGGVKSAFSSIESKDTVTPSFYGNTAMGPGKAIASSTPAAARSLNFTASTRPEASAGLSTDKGTNYCVSVPKTVKT